MTDVAKKLVYLLPMGIILIYAVEGQNSPAPPKFHQLVPAITQGNYELLPDGDKYSLRRVLTEICIHIKYILSIPDDKRLEDVELLTDENGKKLLTVKRSLELMCKDTPFQMNLLLNLAIFVEGREVYESPDLRQLVPTINQANYELLPNDDGYQLRLGLPNGGERIENAKLLTDGSGNRVLTVKGLLNLVYPDSPFQVTVVYEADEKGYRAKYMYRRIEISAAIPALASANLLKSAVG